MMADDSKPMHELRFDAAVKVIQSLPPDGSFQPSNDMMLKFYSYYKQATQGPCDIPRPGFWDPVGKAKWDAWNSLGNMTKEDAMVAYVDEMKLILESMPVTDEVEELLHVLGPFYEMVDERKKITQVSDLTTGFGSMLTSPPKSVTKSIVRSLVMNGSLESSSKKIETNSSKIKEQEEKIERETEVLSMALKGSVEKPTIHLSNGSLEHKASSLTNGTHSSKAALNSEDSEEELLHSPQPTEVMEINGYHSGHKEDKSGAHHLASDSDSEVYCDSVDQFGLEESSELLVNHSLETTEASHDPGHSGHSAASRADPKVFGGGTETGILLGKSKGIQHGGEDGKHNGDAPQRERMSSGRPDSSMARRGRVSRSAGPGAGAQGGLLGGGGDGERWGPEGGARGSLNEQIVTALARLQEDMQSVLQRLQTLEALTASQARSLNLQSNYPYPLENKVNKPLKPSWWPFDVSPGTVAFAVAWPFVVQWLVRLYIQQRRRKMN